MSEPQFPCETCETTEQCICARQPLGWKHIFDRNQRNKPSLNKQDIHDILGFIEVFDPHHFFVKPKTIKTLEALKNEDVS